LIISDHLLPGDVIVNEVMVDPDTVNDVDGEYIELYNRTSGNIDLNGWVLRDCGVDYHIIDNGGPLVIGPDELIVLARNAVIEENGGVEAQYEYTGFVLSNSLDEVILVDVDGVTIDSLIYSSDLGFPSEAGSALELRNPYWDNAMGPTWANADEPFGMGDHGTPGWENSAYEEFKWIAVDAAARSQTVDPGDSLVIDVQFFNPAWLDWTCEAASFLVLPNGSPFGGNPLDGPVNLSMPAGRVMSTRMTYFIPGAAFAGVYKIYYGVRERGGEVLDYEKVEFEVSSLRAR
jgi:hypothetical protein